MADPKAGRIDAADATVVLRSGVGHGWEERGIFQDFQHARMTVAT